jgi:hypothetical protein
MFYSSWDTSCEWELLHGETLDLLPVYPQEESKYSLQKATAAGFQKFFLAALLNDLLLNCTGEKKSTQ